MVFSTRSGVLGVAKGDGGFFRYLQVLGGGLSGVAEVLGRQLGIDYHY